MQTDIEIELDTFKCPHCDAVATEVTFIGADNKDKYEYDGNWSWTTTVGPARMSVWLLYECGGETGWEMRIGRPIRQADGETENRCPEYERAAEVTW
jgi:uncharacterized C2H2 Zn-finger protein